MFGASANAAICVDVQFGLRCAITTFWPVERDPALMTEESLEFAHWSGRRVVLVEAAMRNAFCGANAFVRRFRDEGSST